MLSEGCVPELRLHLRVVPRVLLIIVLLLWVNVTLWSVAAAELGPSIVSTSLGRFAIAKVELADRFPPDCEGPPSPMCEHAKQGYQVLIVWLEPQEGQKTAEVASKLADASKGVEVVAEDGSRTKCCVWGGMLDGKLLLAFTPEASDKKFGLVWPGNAAVVDLGR